MQTFLPYADYKQTARILDGVRLRNQRREVKSILTTISTGKGWIHHPATKMWIGHERSLINYCIEICDEVVRRGWQDTVADELLDVHWYLFPRKTESYPKWFGDPRLHSSHQANLVRKMPLYYGLIWPEAEPTTEYFWPTKVEEYAITATAG